MFKTQLLHWALQLPLLLPAIVLAQQPAIPPKYKASPAYVANLPKYCYQQYVDGSLGGYEYSIPAESCGHAMNHFCPALVFLMQAQQYNLPKSERIGAVNAAVNEVFYTQRQMKPGCFIAADVQAAGERAKLLQRLIK